MVASASWIYTPEIRADVVLYLDESWARFGEVIEWPDGSVPKDRDAAARAIREGFEAARQGKRVEVGCIAGHGRTGTVLACMAALAGVPGPEAVDWVREHYCEKAVEGPYQEPWIEWFAETFAAPRSA